MQTYEKVKLTLTPTQCVKIKIIRNLATMITPHAYFKFSHRGVSSGIIAFDECEYIDKLIIVYDFKLIGVIEVVHPFMYLTITQHFRTNVLSQMLMT